MEVEKRKEQLRKIILLVDDDPDVVDVVRYILIKAGFEVQTHNSGNEVEEVVMHYKPDLILLDIGLPGISGTEVCKQIKKLHSVPIVFFSAHSEKAMAYKECMADGFIEKPFDLKEFVETVKSYLT